MTSKGMCETIYLNYLICLLSISNKGMYWKIYLNYILVIFRNICKIKGKRKNVMF